MSAVYFDVSCLNRPFDDQSQPRVLMEAEAIAIIFDSIDVGRNTHLSSQMVLMRLLRYRIWSDDVASNFCYPVERTLARWTTRSFRGLQQFRSSGLLLRTRFISPPRSGGERMFFLPAMIAY